MATGLGESPFDMTWQVVIHSASTHTLKDVRMNELTLAFAFSAGMLATVNPCGWAMLPAYVAFYLGSRDPDYNQRSLRRRLPEAIGMGALSTLGVILVFGTIGVLFASALQALSKITPFVAMFVGAILVVLGVGMLLGKRFPISLPTPQADVRQRNAKAMFLFGVGYGTASLSCTFPIFLVVVGATLTTNGPGESLAMLISYMAGMAAVLMSVAIATALLKESFGKRIRSAFPYMHRISAVLLVFAGIYIIWFQTRYLPFVFASF